MYPLAGSEMPGTSRLWRAIGTDDNPVISYQDSTAGALKVARLSG